MYSTGAKRRVFHVLLAFSNSKVCLLVLTMFHLLCGRWWMWPWVISEAGSVSSAWMIIPILYFFFSLQAILDINEVCQTHFQTQTLPNVIPGPLVTLLMEKKMWTKLSVKNTNLEVLSWWEKWISRFRQILETSVLNVFVHLFRDFGISRRSAFLLFLFFPIH